MAGVKNEENSIKKSMKNTDFLETWLESDFSTIWDRFGGHFGSQMGPKIEEKSMKILIEIRSLIFEGLRFDFGRLGAILEAPRVRESTQRHAGELPGGP